MVVVRPFEASDSSGVASLLGDAFWGDFAPTGIRVDSMRAAFESGLARGWSRTRAVATERGVVVGTLGLQVHGAPGPRWSEVLEAFRAAGGDLAALRFLLSLGRMSYRPPQGEVYLSDVAVERHSRGSGIGSRLLDWAIEQGRWRNAHELSLFVAVSNPNARRLYETKGFVDAPRRSTTQWNAMKRSLGATQKEKQ